MTPQWQHGKCGRTRNSVAKPSAITGHDGTYLVVSLSEIDRLA